MIRSSFIPNRKELSQVLTSFPSIPKNPSNNNTSNKFPQQKQEDTTIIHQSTALYPITSHHPHLSSTTESEAIFPLTPSDLNNNNPFEPDKNHFLKGYGKQREYSLPPMEAAVRIRNGTLSYGSGDKMVPVLNGLNMTIPVGCIYGLLGPSGCGKTTLLRCIIGCLKLKSGYVRVFSHKPGDPGSGIPGSGCGYMPQEVALHEDLTIHENLVYYGRLHNLDYHVINLRIDHLIEFLDLPDAHKLICNLSGGQKRRVSFASALIHKPRLIILDEPTVGVDPILRERIWDALIQITERDKMTVIITTHYIEETKRAHTVAFMRRGVLLAEDSPSALIMKYQSSTLEDVFFKLSLHQKKEQQVFKKTLKNKYKSGGTQNVRGIRFSQKRSSASYPSDTLASFSSLNSFDSVPAAQIKDPFIKSFHSWMVKYQTVTQKIMKQSVRQPNLMFLQFILPLISLFLFCTCVGHTPRNVQLNIVNMESPELLSHFFIKNINPEIISIKRYDNLADATASVKRKEAWGVLYISSNFSNAMIQRAHFHESEKEITNDTISHSIIQIYADLTNKVLSVTMERTLESAFEKFLIESLIELEYNPKLFDYPIKIGQVIYGRNSGHDYFAVRDYGVPGLLVILTYSCAFASTVLILNGENGERNDDFMDRNFVSGVTTTHLIMSHLTSRLPAMSFNVIALFIVAVYFFDAPSNGSIIGASGLLFLQSVAGLTHGMLISALSRTFFMSMVLSNFVLLGMFIISGVLWPLASLPTWVRYLSYVQPTTIPTESLRNILSKGMDMSSLQVLSGYGITFSWIIIFFIGSIFIFHH